MRENHLIRSGFMAVIAGIVILSACKSANSNVEITGEMMQWHKVTLTVDGPLVHEEDSSPNPFLDYRMTVIFRHESDSSVYTVPGYFAADGNAAESSAQEGNKWRAHLSPDKPGTWYYEIKILQAENIAVETHPALSGSTEVLTVSGSFRIRESTKRGRDFRAKGRLEYVGERYLRFSGSGEYFLKAGADSPENLLAYADFDGTSAHKEAGIERANEAATSSLKTWEAHRADWKPGDPVWKVDKGKGLVGALNYLAGKGCNAFSFLTYNAGGDGDDVWPFVSYGDKLHYDCSKLDQWQVLFDHAQELGLYLHFKLQETENDDHYMGGAAEVPAALDGGDLGTERKLYLRELVARFGYLLALNWNLGEENTQTPEQQRAMAGYLHSIDPCHHPIVIHTFPDWQDRVYTPLLGDQSELTGISLQNGWENDHQRVVYWLEQAEKAGKKWVVANDEQNPHYTGVPPDSGYEGFEGIAYPEKYSRPYTIHDIRKYTLWGVLMAGGAGVEYYFGYTLPQTDLNCEDWRSRDRSWDYCRIALDFFTENSIPFREMKNADERVGNPDHGDAAYCLAKQGEIYLVYLPMGGKEELDLGETEIEYDLYWFNPRQGGEMIRSEKSRVKGPGKVDLGRPPSLENEDWLVVLRKRDSNL